MERPLTLDKNRETVEWLLASLVFVMISLIAFRKLLSPGVITMEGEWSIPPFPDQIRRLFLNDLHPWKNSWDFGARGDGPTALPYNFLLFVLASAGLDGSAISKLIPISVLTMSGLTMFYLCKQLNLGSASSIASGFSYMLFPWVFDQISIGHPEMVLSYACCPLVLALFMKSVEQKMKIRPVALTGIFYALAITQLGFLFVLTFSLILLIIFLRLTRRNEKSFRSGFSKLLLVLLIGALLHSFWIISYMQDVVQNQLSTLVSGSLGFIPIRFLLSFASPIQTTRLLGNPLYFDSVLGTSFQSQLIVSIPILIGSAAVLAKPREVKTLFFATLVACGIALAGGAGGPLGPYWQLLLQNVPVLRVFRDPSKWLPIAGLGNAVLIGIFLDKSRKYLAIRFSSMQLSLPILTIPRHQRLRINILSLFMLTISIAAVLSSASPFLTGDFGGYLKPYAFGQQYNTLWNQFSSDPGDYRVLALPAPYPTLYLDYGKTNTFGNGYDVIYKNLGKPDLYQGTLYSPQLTRFLIKTLYENRTNELAQILSIANVKYVILDPNKVTTATDNNWVSQYFPQEQYTNQKLESTILQQNMVAPSSEIGSIQVFQNQEWLPHIFSTPSLGFVGGDLNSLISLSYSDALRLNDSVLVFPSQLSASDLTSLSQIPGGRIIVQDNRFLDIVLGLVENKQMLNPVDYLTAQSPLTDWAPMFWTWHNWYYQASLERLAFTLVPSKLAIPFTTPLNGSYEIFMKQYESPQGSSTTAFLDDSMIGQTETRTTAEPNFVWTELGPINLGAGSHTLAVQSGDGENALGDIVIAQKGAVEQALESYSNIAQGRQILLLFKPDTWTDPTSRTWTLNGDMLAGLFGQTTQQAGQSYHIGLSNELATVTLFMHYNQSIGESFNFRYPFQSQISLDKYQSFSVAYNVDNPQFQDVSPLLEIAWNGDNKTDAWLRLDKYASSPSIQIRQDGTYDIRVPSLPVEQDGFLHYQINVQRTLESLFPDKQLTQLVGFRLVLEKAFNADATGINAKNYTFYIKNVVVSGTDWSPLSMGVEASQGSVMAMNYLHRTPLNSTIYIPRDGFYQLQVRGASDLAPTNMTAVSDGVHMNFTLFSLSQGLQWHQSQRVYLTRGWSSLSIIPSGEARIYLDEILVSSADSTERS